MNRRVGTLTLALTLHLVSAVALCASVKRVDTAGNVLAGAQVRSSSSQPTFPASAVLDGLIRSDANGDNGLFFASDDRDQRLAIAGMKGPIREIRLLGNVGDLSRLPRTVTIRASNRDMPGEPSLEVADYPVELFKGSPTYRQPAGDPPDDQVFIAPFAVEAPADTRALLLSFGDAAAAGDRISEIQAFAAATPFVRQGGPDSRVVLSTDDTRITFLGWDTEVGNRANVNLLRRNAAAHVKDVPAAKLDVNRPPMGADFDLTVSAPDATADLKFVFPFSPATSATTVLPARVTGDAVFHLPAVVSAPGYGQMLVTAPDGTDVTSRLVGNRGAKTVDWILDVPGVAASAKNGFKLSFKPVIFPAPKGLNDDARWAKVRRGWFNVFQVTASWGDPKNPFSAPSGVLGNNVISDPVSCCLFEYADSALWTPDLAPGVSAMAAVGRTLDWWLAPAAGQTVRFNFGEPATRPVVGRLVLKRQESDVDWTKVTLTLSARPQERRRAGKNDQPTTVPKPHDPVIVPVKSDGTFRIDSVNESPTGAWQLLLDETTLPPRSNDPTARGRKMSGGINFELPASPGEQASSPIDLGDVRVQTSLAPLAVGMVAPPIEATTLDGKPFKLSDYKGKYVLLDFWATWCGPCIGETPHLKKVHEAFAKDDRFVMIGLSMDTGPDDALGYTRQNGMNWVQGFIGFWGKHPAASDFGVNGIPAILLIGPEGKVIATELRGEKILEKVSEALNAAKS